VAAGDDAGAAQIVTSLVAAGGFAGLDVTAGCSVVASGGDRVPLVAPVTRPLIDVRDSSSARPCSPSRRRRAMWAWRTRWSGVAVLVRAGAHQLAGTFAGPAMLPSSGPVTYLGVRYAVASVAAVPNVAARAYVLVPD
jgi:hypothetical protein